jgi:hypothetical protein
VSECAREGAPDESRFNLACSGSACALVSLPRGCHASQAAVKGIDSRTDRLVKCMQRVRRELMQPFQELRSHVLLLERTQAAGDTLRRVLRLEYTIRKLKSMLVPRAAGSGTAAAGQSLFGPSLALCSVAVFDGCCSHRCLLCSALFYSVASCSVAFCSVLVYLVPQETLTAVRRLHRRLLVLVLALLLVSTAATPLERVPSASRPCPRSTAATWARRRRCCLRSSVLQARAAACSASLSSTASCRGSPTREGQSGLAPRRCSIMAWTR